MYAAEFHHLVIAQEVTMDFVERFLGIAPDAGNGLLELLLCMAVASTMMVLVWRSMATAVARLHYLLRPIDRNV